MVNYYEKFLGITNSIEKESSKKTLLLHSCCAPCSSASLEKLVPYFFVTIFFYNPNITSREEYQKRLLEQRRFLQEVYGGKVKLIEGDFCPEKFYKLSSGLEKEPEKGARCFLCYKERLLETCKIAKKLNFDYFATTLTLSPHKNAQKLNEIGFILEEKFDAKYLPTDLKKGGGYARSIELSKIYNLYRQNYCGCEFSKRV